MSATSLAAHAAVFESPRLRMRRVSEQDAPFILALLNDPGWLRYIGDRGVRTLGDARRYIEQGPCRMYAEHGFGLYLIERKDDGAPLGLCGLIRRDTLPDVDIGFALAEPFRGQGYAFEAAAATLRYARESLKLARVVAIALPENHASTRLLERLGLRFERTIAFGPAGEELNYFGTTPEFAVDAGNPPSVVESVRHDAARRRSPDAAGDRMKPGLRSGHRMRVLFVCMGNICRSPTAEAVFREYVRRHAPDLELEIDSAGTHDYHVGEPPDPRALRAAASRGLDLSGLRARQVEQADFDRFDLILAMDRLNYATLLDRSPPQFHPRIRRLLEFAKQTDREDVPDPYYGGAKGFEEVLDLLEDAASGLLAELRRKVS
jgi:protein-tyrosine-phosphatase/RimJ/RimL family protein N-acetyltransferase